MASLTIEYKRSDEYKIFRQHILSDAPDLPEYLVDMVISLHLAKPLMYRDKKVLRHDMLSGIKPSRTYETLEGLVTVVNPDDQALHDPSGEPSGECLPVSPDNADPQAL